MHKNLLALIRSAVGLICPPLDSGAGGGPNCTWKRVLELNPHTDLSIWSRCYRYSTLQPFSLYTLYQSLNHLYQSLYHLYQSLYPIYQSLNHLYQSLYPIYQSLYPIYQSLNHLYQSLYHLYQSLYHIYQSLYLLYQSLYFLPISTLQYVPISLSSYNIYIMYIRVPVSLSLPIHRPLPSLSLCFFTYLNILYLS